MTPEDLDFDEPVALGRDPSREEIQRVAPDQTLALMNLPSLVDQPRVQAYVGQLLQFVFKLDLPPFVLKKLGLPWLSKYAKSLKLLKQPFFDGYPEAMRVLFEKVPLIRGPSLTRAASSSSVLHLPTPFDLSSFIRSLADALFTSIEETSTCDVLLVLLDKDSPLALRQALVSRASSIPEFDLTLTYLFKLSQRGSSSAAELLLFLAQSLTQHPAFLQRIACHPNKPPALIEFFLDHPSSPHILQALASDSTLSPIYSRRIVREHFYYRLEAKPVHSFALVERYREQFKGLVTLCRESGICGFESADPMDDEVLRRVRFSASRLQIYVHAATSLLNGGAIPKDQREAFAANLSWLDQFHRLWINRDTPDGENALMDFVRS